MILLINIDNSISSNDNDNDNDKKILASVLAEASIARGEINENDRSSAIFSALHKVNNEHNDDNNKHNDDNNTTTTTTTTTTTATTTNILAKRELPDNATVWELFQEQIRSDFAPLIMILPQPVKAFISDQYNLIKDPCKKIILGAAQPMLKAASIVFNNVGNLMIVIGKECNKLATSIADKNGLEVNEIKSSSAIHEDIYIEDGDYDEIIEI